jgi:cytochrome c oxidase subunit 2
MLAALAGVSACDGNQNVFNPAGPAARGIADLGWFLLTVCGVVYLLVLLALGWAIARERREADTSPATTHRLHLVVGIAVGLTACTLMLLTASSVWAGRSLASPRNPRPALKVAVVGFQWWWQFEYQDRVPANSVTVPNELHVPVGVAVELSAISRDVVHSFWAPNLYGKRDLIPGQETIFWLQADRPGVYRGQCAEFCGHQHAHMAFVVVAEPQADFDAWLARQRQPAQEPESAAAVQGQRAFMRGACASCHAVRGTLANGNIGPDLTHVGSRATVGAGTLSNTHDHLAVWLADTQTIKPGARMPSHLVAGDDREAVVAYLRSLR